MAKGDGNRGKGRGVRWLREHLNHQGDECLTWPYALDGKGYGSLSYNGRLYKASRLMCIFKHGPAPSDEHQAAHSCGNGHLACTSPNHVFWRTPLENRIESNEHGTGNPPAPRRLTIDAVAEIRASSSSYADMAAQYGVHPDTIGKIFRGETWQNPRSTLTTDQIRQIKDLDTLGRTTMNDQWQPISLAPAGEVVMTKIDDEHGERNVGPLKRRSNLWFTPDGAMYVYYTPTHWRRIVDEPPMSGVAKSVL